MTVTYSSGTAAEANPHPYPELCPIVAHDRSPTTHGLVVHEIALRPITSYPWVLSVGRQSSAARGLSPLAFACDASDSKAPNEAA